MKDRQRSSDELEADIISLYACYSMVTLANNICNKQQVPTKGLIIFAIILLIKVTLIGCTNTSTVCFGVPGLSCTTHSLSCTSPLVIQIINTTYGYRSGCNNKIGLNNCSYMTCCKVESGDCFIPFASDEHQQVLRNCSGVETCTLFGLREVSGRVCGGTDSAYSKIQYDCVTPGSIETTLTQTANIQPTTLAPSVTASSASTETSSIPPTSQLSTTIQLNSTTLAIFSTVTEPDVGETSNVGSIVGGIFGAIIIIVTIIVVVVFLYKRQNQSPQPPSTDNKMKIQTVSQHYHVIDGPGTISGYDEIELDNKPQEQATAVHLYSSTNNNRIERMKLDSKSKLQTTDNYDHVGDDNLKVKSPNDLDNYNHIGTHDHSVHEDNYNHIGNNPLSSNHLEVDYNHINGVFDTFNDEDDYNHIDNNDNNNVITDDNYHHIGSGDVKMEGDYDHIGSETNNNQVFDESDSPYNLATC